jgi:Na+-transporting methylmalonyl-CoA/oxaloacetate decarboxylase beta subunit
LTVETLGILALCAVAVSIGTSAGILMAKVMSKLSSQKNKSINWCYWRFCRSYGGQSG